MCLCAPPQRRGARGAGAVVEECVSIPTGRPPPAPVIIAAAHPEPGPGHGTDSTVSTPSWARGREGELEGGGVPTLRRPSPPPPKWSFIRNRLTVMGRTWLRFFCNLCYHRQRGLIFLLTCTFISYEWWLVAGHRYVRSYVLNISII